MRAAGLCLLSLALLPLAGCIVVDTVDAVGSAASTAVSAGSTVVGAGVKTVGAAADTLGSNNDDDRTHRRE